MSDLVTLRHPSLPETQTIRIDRRRIGAHLAAGWEEATEPPATEQESEPTESEPKRRSRKSTEEQ